MCFFPLPPPGQVLSWVGFSIMTGVPISYLFTIVGALQVREFLD